MFFPVILLGVVKLDLKVLSWNAAYRVSGNRIYKTSEASDYQTAVSLSYKGQLYDSDVEVFIEFGRFPLIDIDNAVKLTLDALEGKAYKRDRQVVRLSVDRHKCEKGDDWVYVSVEPLEEGI